MLTMDKGVQTSAGLLACAGEKQVVKDSVWLRAASGGIVCSNADDELVVAVNAAPCPARECSFTFESVDPNR